MPLIEQSRVMRWLPERRWSLNLMLIIFLPNARTQSKALQESINSSSATIRNDMATLEKQGLLEKAHTSSGRMPSVAGFSTT